MMETKRKTRIGFVVSTKMDKTVVVTVETTRRHPIYKKIMRRATKYKAHDESNRCHLGDKVKIIEVRPLSKDKRWKIAEIIIKGQVAEIQPQEIVLEAGPQES